jgi:UrcA family protein
VAGRLIITTRRNSYAAGEPVMTTRIFIATLATLAATQAATAQATEPEANSITVHYDDLNLSTRAGVDVLQKRIRTASRIVCGNEFADFSQVARYRSCVRLATAKALAKVELPVTSN